MSFETYSTVTQEIIEVDEVNRLYKIAGFSDPNGVPKGCTPEDPEMINRLDEKIKTIIYTDGKITKVEESAPTTIDEYYINGKKYTGEVNQLIKKKLYIENPTYIVKVIIADEVSKYGKNGLGDFNIIKDIKILLKDKNNKEAKKKAKETVKAISSDSRNCKSIWGVFLNTKSSSADSIAYEKIADNVYKLKQKKQSR